MARSTAEQDFALLQSASKTAYPSAWARSTRSGVEPSTRPPACNCPSMDSCIDATTTPNLLMRYRVFRHINSGNHLPSAELNIENTPLWTGHEQMLCRGHMSLGQDRLGLSDLGWRAPLRIPSY